MAPEPVADLDKFMDGLAEDLEQSSYGKKPSRGLDRVDFKKQFIYWGAGAFVLIILVALFFGSCNRETGREQEALQARVTQLENRLTRLNEMETRLTQVENQLIKLQKAAIRPDKPPATPVASGAPQAAAKAERRSHIVRSGDSLYVIAKKYSLTIPELCRFNQITPKELIRPGDQLWLEPEQP